MLTYKTVKILIGDELYNEYKLKQINDNSFEYQDDTCNNVIELNDSFIKIVRENEEFQLIMNSNEEVALYTLKELNYELDIKINYFDQIEDDNNLIIAYQLETNDKEIKLIMKGE